MTQEETVEDGGRIRGLRHSDAGREVLRGLNFTVKRGEIYALLGGNGAGKSTTLSILLGFLAPSAGSVRVCRPDTAFAQK